MEEITRGVYRLGSQWVNFYFVAEGEAITIVDTGFPGYVPAALSALEGLGRRPSDVKAIVLTHTHSDHIGGAAELAKETGAPVFVHEREAAIATGAAKPVPPKGVFKNFWRPNMLRFLKHAIGNGGAKRITVPDVTTFGADDVLDVPGKPRVVFTPGHSSAHSALLLEDRRFIFCGDAMATLAVQDGDTGPMLHPFNENRDGAIESLAVLEKVDADVVAPGHGDPWRGAPSEAVRMARTRL